MAETHQLKVRGVRLDEKVRSKLSSPQQPTLNTKTQIGLKGWEKAYHTTLT